LIVIGLVVLFAGARFGGAVALRFKCAALQVGLVRVDPNTPVGATTLKECSGDAKPAPAVPPPPLPPDSPTDPKRHHLGDGDSGQPNNPLVGGNLPTEGLSADFQFELTQEQIDFAREHGGKFLLTFQAFGVAENTRCSDASCGSFLNSFISPDTVQIDGKTIGLTKNGNNTLTVDASSLSPGEHTIQLNTGSLDPSLTLQQAKQRHELDDFEYQGLSLGFTS